VIESTIKPGIGRQGSERHLPSRGAYDIAHIHDHYMELAHSQGQGTGFEAPYAIRLAARLINQGYQNIGIEAFARELAGMSAEGVEFKLTTATKTQERTLELEWIEYSIEVIDGAKKRDLLSFKLVAEGSSGMPRIEDAWLTSDAGLQAIIELPEMGCEQRAPAGDDCAGTSGPGRVALAKAP
jgi:hypothetical protein